MLPLGIDVDTRQLILSRALGLFSARGYDAVGVQELVTAAGVTKPTLYHHFGNKEGVLAALVAEDSGPLLEKLAAAADYRGDLQRNLLELASVYLAFGSAQPHFYRLLSTCYLAPPESDSYRLAVPVRKRQHEIVEALFEAAARDHGNMKGRARRYAYSFVGLIDTYVRLALSGEVEASGGLEHDVVRQFSYGIYS